VTMSAEPTSTPALTARSSVIEIEFANVVRLRITGVPYSYPSTSNTLSPVTQEVTTVRLFTYGDAGNVTADTRSGTPFGDLQFIAGSASNNLRFPGEYFLIKGGLFASAF